MVSRIPDGGLRIKGEEIKEWDPKYEGHINRNIKLAMAMIEVSKPYIEIVKYEP